MSKYNDLVNILDRICDEAPKENKRYHPDSTDTEKVNQARSRAYIHLFLKVKFGLTDFLDRENFVTDGPSDGGLDAYFIDDNEKSIYFIQSKYRNTDRNFTNKEITMLSDETIYSDKVGKRNKAEVMVTNPQIINGGQTAYTLSILYDKHLLDNTLEVFEGKDVLLKIISFDSAQENKKEKLKLIEDISIATNQQSPVYEADRRSNDAVQIQLQQLIYKDFGLYYERKRGEFGDGLRKKYINRSEIIDREQFLRICMCANDYPERARSSSINLWFEKKKFDSVIPDAADYRKWVFTYLSFNMIKKGLCSSPNVANLARFAIACVMSHRYNDAISPSDFSNVISADLDDVLSKWDDFEKYVRNDEANKAFYFREVYDRETGEHTVETNWSSYYKGRTLSRDLKAFFKF